MTIAHELDRVLSAKAVPTPPVVMVRVMEVKRNPEAGLSDLVNAVKLDGALTARLIAMANSPVYRRDREATTVDRAVAQIGARSVTTLALAHSLAKSMPKTGRVGGVELADFWRRSLVAGASARALADELCADLREEAFFVGLMGGVGRLALADSMAERYEAMAAESDGWPTTEAETQNFGLSSLKVTAEILRRWDLPDLFSDAIDGIESLDVSDAAATQLSTVARLAERVSNFFASARDGFAYRELVSVLADAGVDAGAIDPMLDGIGAEVGDLASQLDLTETGLDADEILEQARSELIELTLAADVELRSERERREELEVQAAELERRATRDPLTDLPNRRAFDEQFEQQLRLRMRAPETFGKPMGVIMIDLDHFKSVNDTHGHQIGDDVLIEVARVLEMASRTEETVARFGGEEFVMLAPMATLEELTRAAERLRKSIELVEVPLPDGDFLEVTASLGVAAMQEPKAAEAGQRLLVAADEALYEAKHAGRNCVKVVPELVV